MMTVAEIRDHAARLQNHAALRRRQIEHGVYRGSREANLALISALEGRVAELLAHCDAVEAVLFSPEPLDAPTLALTVVVA